MTMGCKDCEHHYQAGGEPQCAFKPHDYATHEQRAIVAWLSAPLREAWTDGGCPGFRDWRAKGKER